MKFQAWKVLQARGDVNDSAAEVIGEPILVARASGTCVTPKAKQRLAPAGPRAPVILTAAIVGAETTRAQTPHLPLTPEEIGEEARRCREAGAAVIHLHAREPDGTPTQSKARFGEFIAAIRERTDVIVQTSTGGAVGMSIEERCQPLTLAPPVAPEMATLNIASMNFGNDVFLNRTPDVEQVAGWIRERRLIAEIEVYDLGHLDAARALLKKGLIAPPLHFQFVMGVPGGVGASERALDAMVAELGHGFPAETTWAVAAVGRHQLPMAELAIRRGGHARVGLEDNIYVEKGVLAKGSAELVERAAGFAREAGREIATPEVARRLLGLA